jgi:glutathione S-transferase
MKLYYSKGACSLVVRIIIHEIGLKSDFESVDLKTKKTEKGTDYLTVNHKGAVPTLITADHKILTENAVILQYLADHYKAHDLLPEQRDFHRYRVLEWVNFVTTDLHKTFSLLFNQDVPDEVKENIIKPILLKKFTYADHHLKKHKYITGDSFTLPDAYLFVMLFWAHHLKIDLSELPNLNRLYKDLRNRKSVHLALEEEGLLIK